MSITSDFIGWVTPIAAGQVRHLATGAAGVLVTRGVLSSDQGSQAASIASALVLYGVGAGWSWYQKSGQATLQDAFSILQSKIKQQAAAVRANPASTAAGATPAAAALSTLVAHADMTPAELVKLPNGK